MAIAFTAHNIRLKDGSRTKPEARYLMEEDPWLVSARRVLDAVLPGERTRLRLVDLGCLEGGYSVEFCRMGFNVLGIDVRQENIDVCNHVAARTGLSNLAFAKDNVLNISSHGTFDVSFCCGLLYHLDRPRDFLKTLGAVTRKVLIVQTHFAPDNYLPGESLPRPMRRAVQELLRVQARKSSLSPNDTNEGLTGRWFQEFANEEAFSKREGNKWASWDNKKSFWLHRSSLLQAISEAGFDLVMEQFDSLGPNIAESMQRGYYKTDCRGTFVGIKTGGMRLPGA
jgi:SAM-dependent methyltransferase